MPFAFDRAFQVVTDPFMPPNSAALDADHRRRARLALGVVAGILACALVALVWLTLHGIRDNAAVVGLLAIAVLPIPILLRTTGSLRLSGHLIAAAVAVELAVSMFHTGARTVMPFALLPGIPMVATLIAGTRAGFVWALVCLAQIGSFYALSQQGLEPRIALSPEFLEQGRFMGAAVMLVFVLIVTHCYEHLKTRALADLVSERSRQIELRDHFLSHVSHELRTPVAAAQQFVSLVLDGIAGRLEDEQREHLQGAMRNTQQLVEMIDDLVSVSRGRAGELEISPEPMPVEDPLRRALLRRAEQAAGREVSLKLEVGESLPLARADERALADVLDKLLEHAICFSPSGGRVVVSARALPTGEVRVGVTDQGPAIEPEHRKQIFDGLQMAPMRATPEWASRKGLGLSLAIVRQLVEGMGGHIGAASPPGGGTEMSFTLPGCRRAALRTERGTS